LFHDAEATSGGPANPEYFQVPRKLEEIGGRSEIVSVLDYDTFSELQFGVPKPDFGAAGLSAVISAQQFATPRQLRIGIRCEF